MNCDCVEKLEKAFLERFKIEERDIHNKVEIPVQLQLVGNKMISTTCTDTMVMIKGKKTFIKINHNYCPFCGDKIEKEVSNEES